MISFGALGGVLVREPVGDQALHHRRWPARRRNIMPVCRGAGDRRRAHRVAVTSLSSTTFTVGGIWVADSGRVPALPHPHVHAPASAAGPRRGGPRGERGRADSCLTGRVARLRRWPHVRSRRCSGTFTGTSSGSPARSARRPRGAPTSSSCPSSPPPATSSTTLTSCALTPSRPTVRRCGVSAPWRLSSTSSSSAVSPSATSRDGCATAPPSSTPRGCGRFTARRTCGTTRSTSSSRATNCPRWSNTRLGRIGVVVCYDIEFPEWTRTAALCGADLLCVPTNWPAATPPGERPEAIINAQAAALANRMFVTVCDRVGRERGVDWAGASAIIGPNGYPLALAEPGGAEQTLITRCDLTLAREKTSSTHNDALLDRRPALYGLLTAHPAARWLLRRAPRRDAGRPGARRPHRHTAARPVLALESGVSTPTSVGRIEAPLIGTRSCGHADRTTTTSRTASRVTASPGLAGDGESSACRLRRPGCA